jgi:heme/copper-type cytochrome/quinol oxidase subunit 2
MQVVHNTPLLIGLGIGIPIIVITAVLIPTFRTRRKIAAIDDLY